MTHSKVLWRVQECLVDEDGCYTEGAGSALQGLPVLSKGSQAVMDLLSADILHAEQFLHSYPYDWRTKQPVILRASCQWFIDTNALKQKAIVSNLYVFCSKL